MSTTEERIARIHERAKELGKERKRRVMRIEAAVSTMLAVCLIATIGFISRSGGASAVTASDAGYAGASLVGVEAGGYILVALLAFMLGAIITSMIRSYFDKNKDQYKGGDE